MSPWPRRRRNGNRTDRRIDRTERSEGKTDRTRQDRRIDRRAKRRAFFLALSSNVKWIMIAAAVIVAILAAKFGLGSLLSGV